MHTGFPTIRAEWQKLENPDLRKALKMKVRATSEGHVWRGGAGREGGNGWKGGLEQQWQKPQGVLRKEALKNGWLMKRLAVFLGGGERDV
jgi:hypothetical protein